MTDINQYLGLLKDEIVQLAKQTLKDNWQAGVKDGQAFVEKTKVDLARWTKLLADGELTKDDFKSLVMGTKDLAEMEMLKQAGLKLSQTDKFRRTLLNLVIDSAFKVIL